MHFTHFNCFSRISFSVSATVKHFEVSSTSSDSGSSPVSSGMNSTALGGRMSTIFNGDVSMVVGKGSSSVATTSFDGRSSGGMKWAPSSSALLEGSEIGVTIISTGSGSNLGAVSYAR